MTTEDRGTPPVDHDGAGDPRSSSSGGSSGRPAKKRRLSAWQETVVLVVLAIALAAFVKAFLVQSFYIPSESMEPGLVRKDRIVVQKPSYWLGGEPQRGDVVVFEDPGGWLDASSSGPVSPLSKVLAAVGLYPSGGHLVKRVVGVAGDVVECCDDEGRLLVNGVAVEESAYAVRDGEPCYGPMPNGRSGCRQGWTAGPVPPGELFVMGDNRAHSADSSARLCRPERDRCDTDPYVDQDLVVGRLLARIWPADRFDVTDGVDAFADVPDAP